MKIYISGKITGIEEQAEKLFQVAEDRLTAEGYDVINPFKINLDQNKSWEAYMREDVKALCDCDCVYMLLNWQDSKGARIEKQIAEYLKIKIIYE